MADRYADLADLTFRQHVIGVVSSLRRQIERDREAGLALREIFPIERVRLGGVGMPRISAENPRLVASRRFGHGATSALLTRWRHCAPQKAERQTVSRPPSGGGSVRRW